MANNNGIKEGDLSLLVREMEKNGQMADIYKDLIPGLVLFLDKKGNISRINKLGRKILGVGASEEIIGHNWFDNFIRPKDKRMLKKVFNELISTKFEDEKVEYYHYQNYIHTINKEDRLIEWHNRVIRDSQGNVVGILSVGQDVTERTKIKQDLEKSEAQFRTIVETTNDIILTIDLHGKIQYVSPQVHQYGETEENMVGKSFLDFVHPDHQKGLKRRALYVMMHPEESAPYEYVGLTHGGTREVWMQVLSGVLKNEKGKTIGLVSVIRDIDKQKRTETRLDELLQNLNVGIYRREFEPEGKIVSVNPAALAIIEAKTPKDIFKTDIKDFCVNIHDFDVIEEDLQDTGASHGHELELRTLKGNNIWVRITAVLTKESDGRVFVDVIVEDVTKQRKYLEQIKDSEGRYKALSENNPQLILLFGDNGELRYMNKVALENYGYESISKAIASYKFIDSFIVEDKEKAMNAFELAKSGEVSFVELHQFSESGINCSHGVIFAPVKGDENKVNGVIMVATDITEMEVMKQKVSELDNLKSRFMTSLLHVTRTPLNKIRWALEILLSGEVAPIAKEQVTFVKQALSSDNQVISIMENMTVTLDIERDSLTLDRAPTPVVSLIQSVVKQFTPKHNLDGIVCNVNISCEEVTVDIDAHRIRNVVEAIIDNAGRYLRDVERKIEVRVIKENGKIRFEVEDFGIGIPDHEDNYIFERFYRGSNAQLIYPDGMGLGLFISKSVVEGHGGSMGFSSKEGQGSTFWFELPI